MSAHTPAESYSKIASKYDGQSNEYSLWGELARGMYEGIVLKPQYRVIVDVGCGTGAALNHLQGRASPSVQLIGVEPSEQMRRLAEQRNAGIASVELREGSFEKLPLADGSVDYLYSIWAFHWTSDPRRAAEEIRRVLKEDGELDLLFIGLNTGREFARKTAEVLSRYVDLETRLRAASMMASLDRGQVEELFSRFEAVGLTIEEETTKHYDTLDAHWAWQIRSESHYSVIPPGDRDRFDTDLRAAIASLGDDRGIPYTRHSFHVRYRHVDRTFLAVPSWIDDLRAVVESESNRRPVSLCTLAAGSDDDLLTGAAQLRSYLADELRDESPPSDVCAVVNAGPGARSHRLALVADGVESLVQGLQLAAGGGAPALGARGVVKKRPVVAFVFSGQETIRTGVGRELFESCPAFRAGIERCARVADELIEASLVDVLYRDTGGPIEDDIAAQIALFALQYSLAHLWRSWGVHPRVVAGHGLGEYAAACVAGVIPLEDAVRLIVGRGRVLRDLAPRGSMCNVRASFEQVRPYISDKERAVAIAAFNAPKSLVLSGETHALELLRQELTAQLIETTPLQSVRALHSPLMTPAEEAFRSVCREAHLSPPQIAFVSTVDGGREADVSNPEYWVRHMLRPVQFIEAVAALEKRGVSAYVEIGPGTTLIDMVAQFVGEGSAVRVPSLDGQQDDWSSMLACLGALYTQGVDIDWKKFSSPRPHRTVCLLAQDECSAPGARRGGGRDGDQLSGRAVAASSSSAWGWRLEETPAVARLATARRLIRAEVAELLGRDVGEQADQRGLMDLGLDSLRSVALARRLSDRIQQRVPETITFSRLNINALARFVLKALSLDTGEGAAPIAAPAPVEPAAKEVIAIVGVSCRLPGGVVDPDGFWTLLEGARDTVSQGPADRSDVARWLGSNPEVSGKAPVRGASFLSDVTGFDPAVFSISPREALRMDPAHRLLLELCWEALENAAVDPRALVGTKTGLFIGLGPSEYDAVRPQVSTLPEIDPYSGLGTMSSVGVGRVSFVFGLQGPCVTVDTACSSSLVAVHMACQSLRSGECDVALAGGVSLLLSPGNFEWLAKCRALSADGRCKTFAAEADGYGRGEGGAVIVLKRLSRARADGDRVLALIRGSAINHDGASSGMTAPNGSAQEAVLKQALEDAGCAAPSVGYVEAHGTGTSLGDPIEVEALNAIYGNGRSADSAMWLGSVKTNIGHLEYAAGVAGLLKVVLSLQKGLIPAHLHAENLNPRIAWDDIPLAVTRTQMPWPEWNTPRRAGVSSFGISGTNVHMVLEEAPAPERAAELLVLSAESASALQTQAARLLERLKANAELGLSEVAFLATMYSPMEHRLAVTASSREALLAALETAAQGQTPNGAVRGEVRGSRVPKVVFVFPGQGSQWLGMGRQLLAQEPVFRAALEACDQAIQAEAGWSLLTELAADETSSQLGRIDVVQPVLFAMEVALAALWRSWGVEPDAVVGHSMGEVAAAHVAGALSLSDAVAIICRRSRLLKRISGQGEMALVELSLAEAQAALVGYEDRLSVAVSNSPRSTVLAGEPVALSEVLSKLEGAGVFCRRVKVDVASHSPQVDPLREELLSSLASLSPQPVTVPMRSTVTGALLGGPELQASYWADNLRQPVRFSEAVQELLQGGHGLFVEMSPHPILATSVEENRQAAQRDGASVGSLRRGQDERASLLESLGALWVQGYPLAWERLFPAGGRRVPLPTYAWQRERYWIEVPAESATGSRRRAHAGGHPLLGEVQSLSTQTGTRLWETTLDLERLPWLSDHRVQGAVVLPGAAYLEMALSSGAEALGDSPLQFTDLVLAEALAFPGDAAVPVQVVTTEEQPGRLRLQIASRMPGADGSFWRVHARGVVRRAERAQAPARLDLAALQARLGTRVPVTATYTALAAMGLEYGPAFQGLAELWRGEGEALGRVRLPEAAGSPTPYRLHPALLDACFHAAAGLFAASDETVPWVPVKVGSLRLFQRPSGELWCHVRDGSQEPQTADRRSADLWVVDSAGAVVAEVIGLEAQRLARDARRREEDDWFLEFCWEAAKVPAAKVKSGRWLLLGAGGGLGAALCSALEAAGHAVVRAPAVPTSAVEVRALLAQAFDGQPPTALVHLGSLDASSTLDAQAFEGALMRGCDSVLCTVQAVAGMGYRDAPRLWLLTRGAQPTGARDVSVTQAPLLGLGRVIAMEHANLRCARVDLDPAQPAGEVGAVLAELLADDEEEEVALRGDERRVARLVRRPPETGRREKLEPARDRPFRLEMDEPGVLERLVLRATEHRAPGPGEVLIAVEAAGLDFIALMKAMGTYPGPGDGPAALCSECAGRIVAVGEGVQSLAVGQEVMTAAPFGFGSHVTVDARRVVPRPAGLSATQAAALPAVDLASLAERRPERFAALLAEVMHLFVEGALASLPVECLPIAQAPDAFRKMAQARHTGKLVLTLQEPSVQVRVPAPSSAALCADGSYLVTGGLGGLGLSVAGWLAERGAGHLVLVGRSGAASAEQQAAVAALAARGARVTVAKADIADRAQLERVLGEVAATGMPLRGVVHAAGILDDGLLQQQTPERFRAVMAPKVLGALHLHALTREAPLDFFVMYAAGAGLLGSPGQGNYAAANTFLDALAHHRRAQGLPGLSIDWGAFAEFGLAAAQENRGARLAARGMRNLTPGDGLGVLERLLESDRAQVGVVPIDVRQWMEFYPAVASSRLLSRLVAAERAAIGGRAGHEELLARLAAAEPGARARLLEEVLRAQVSQVLRIPEDKLDVDAPLTSLGMDSLMGLELRNRIEATLGITVPATLLWTYPTVTALSVHLAGGTHKAASTEPPHTTVDDTAEIDDMSQDELTRLIAEKFEALA